MGRLFGVVVLIIIGLAFIGSGSLNRSGSPSIGMNAASAGEVCANKRAALEAYLSKAQALGFLRISSRYQVDERPWEVLEHDQKLNLMFAAFCHEVGPTGSGTVLLYGLHDGKSKASMTDGNFFDR